MLSSFHNFLMSCTCRQRSLRYRNPAPRAFVPALLLPLLVLFSQQKLAAQELTETQKAVAEAAVVINDTKVKTETVKVMPQLWKNSFKASMNFGQTALVNWAAGGNSSITMEAYIDGSANYKSEDAKVFWNNRLQLDYGLMYSSDKPIIQKTNDRIYLESKWGHRISGKWYLSADFDFKTQFARGYDYKTPSSKTDPTTGEPLPVTKQDWLDARGLKSDFMSPGYIDLSIGVDYTPCKWFSLNISPLTAGVVVVSDAERDESGMYEIIRKSYSMPLVCTDEQGCEYRRPARFELGAKLKADVKINVNGRLDFTSQLVLFTDYMKDYSAYPCPRINWDNRLSWKLWKFLDLNLSTFMIYDDMVQSDDGTPKVQFKESFTLGFTYYIATKTK